MYYPKPVVTSLFTKILQSFFKTSRSQKFSLEKFIPNKIIIVMTCTWYKTADQLSCVIELIMTGLPNL